MALVKPILLEISFDDYAQAAKSPFTQLTVVISQNLTTKYSAFIVNNWGNKPPFSSP
ncbi:hypothetical protein GCM10027094_20380 [Hafnia psychrotolerans]